MSPPIFRTRRLTPKGSALGPILLIVVALAISSAVFFFFTKKRMEQSKDKEDSASQVVTADKAAPTPASAPVLAPTAPAAPKAGEKSASATPPILGFARPADVGAEIVRSMTSGDTAAAARILAAEDPALEGTAKAVLEKMKELGYKPAPADQVELLGQVDNAMRVAIPLQKLDGQPSDVRLLMDVVKDAKMGWKVGTLRLPKELEAALAAMPGVAPAPAPLAGSPAATAPMTPSPATTPAGLPIPPMPGTAPTAPQIAGKPGTTRPFIVVESIPDALTFASDFVRALLKPDYEKARKLVDEERVPAIKLAGLCIVFEDGQFELMSGRPLMTTVTTENTSWIIAKVQSASMKQDTEFGLEMEKSAAGWRVIGLNLSQLLGDSSKASSQIGVPYTPLVKNPKGGESIALYYEYDQASLHPRAQKQLAIVAGILKGSPGKKLKIGGYTDAKGSDVYNLALSKKRAEAVRQFFIDQGVPPSQVETIAFGAANPLSPNAKPDGSDNPEGRSLNRRAEILLDF